MLPAIGAAVVHTSVEGPSGRGAEDSAVVVGKGNALGRETVDVRRGYDLLAVTTKQTGTKVVGVDQDDVGFLFCTPSNPPDRRLSKFRVEKANSYQLMRPLLLSLREQLKLC